MHCLGTNAWIYKTARIVQAITSNHSVVMVMTCPVDIFTSKTLGLLIVTHV